MTLVRGRSPLKTPAYENTSHRETYLFSALYTEMRLTVSNAIKLTNKFQKKEKSLDKGKKMCGKALKTRLIFRGRAHEIHS